METQQKSRDWEGIIFGVFITIAGLLLAVAAGGHIRLAVLDLVFAIPLVVGGLVGLSMWVPRRARQ